MLDYQQNVDSLFCREGSELLIAYTDASLGDEKAGIGYVIYKGKEVLYSCRKEVPVTNSNTLECLSLIELLRYINEMELKNIIVYTDNKSVVDQIEQGKESNIYIDQILHELSLNPTLKIKWINRKWNKKAHKLSREAMKGLGDEKYDEPINDLISKREKYELKMIVKHRKYMIMQCPVCKEYKPASEFPRFKTDKKKRKCKKCQNKIEFFESPLIKINNT